MSTGSKAHTRHSISKFKPSELEKAFKEADKDNDGCLTQEEYLQVFRDQGVNISGEAADVFFKDKDKDRDGKISLEEFMGQLTLTEKIWHSMDRDGGGTVGIQDASKVVSKYKKSLPQEVVFGLEGAFEKRNKDRIDYGEFCQIMNELKVSSSSSPKKNIERPSRSLSYQVSHNSGKKDSKRLSRQNSLGMMAEPPKNNGKQK